MKNKELKFSFDVTGWKVYPIILFIITGFIDFTVSVALGLYKFVKYLIS